ncbi:hypothetical protein FOB63_004265 [Clavispora lusitaniae]|uniref:Uncharacterized protein n=1 Tax=Clavispora lusitaniae (strain ATCC 42720) TaxID=306902 RepID=C4YA07_CLAL4|nr:uncharacterized protein CLUG_04945 [Clavispora lusitaniae ATCC 42720]EEQ40817.1 predicted protein [Clavispora lusitaniae ATCC 42720]KAF5209302.1 hypothetical protein E0198_004579 [Clavispora lusitaniae]KAF7580963.1 hypothetical protein FOB63_004265 [Clavispora lusitaniae]
MSNPVSKRTSDATQPSPISDTPDNCLTSPSHENIFERSCTRAHSIARPRGSLRSCNTPKARSGRSMSVASNASLGSLGSMSTFCSSEDYIAPVLDTTTEILTDPTVDLNSVLLVCRECGADTRDCRTRLCSGQAQFKPGYNLFRRNSSAAGQRTHSEKPESDPELAEGQTINFYSFADVLDGEQDGEEFSCVSVGEYLS